MTKVMTPVSIQVPITDKDGKPTPSFHRWLQQLSLGTLITKTNGTLDVNSVATSTAKGVLTYFDGGGPYAWPSSSARVTFSRFLMENPDGSFVGMGGTAVTGSQMFGAVDPAFTHWWNFAQISGSKYLIDGDMSYSFTLDAYVNSNKIYHQGNLSFGTGLTYNAGTGVLTASGGGSSSTYLSIPNFRPNNGTAVGASNFACRGILFPQGCTIYSVGFYATVASGTTTVTPGIYNTTAAGIIGTLLATGPTVSGVTLGLNIVPLTTPLVVTAGTYLWVGFQPLVANPTIGTIATSPETAFFGAAGALPTTAPAATYGTLVAAAIFPRIAP